MKKYKKKSFLAHSCTAIGIGLMAWIAGTVAITLLQMMDTKLGDGRDQEEHVKVLA